MLGALLAVVLASSPIITSNPSASGAALTPLSVAPTSTGNAVVVQNNANICLNAACSFSVSANTGSDVGTLQSTGSGRWSVSNTFSASSAITAGLLSANSLQFTGGASGNPPQIAPIGETNVGLRLVVKGTGVVSVVAPLVVQVPKRIGELVTITNADTTFTAVGQSAPTIINVGAACAAAAADTSDAAHQLIKYATPATSATACGISGPYTATAATYQFHWSAVVRTDASAVTTVRYYVGVTKSDLSAVATLAGANAINGCYFRFDSALGDTTWQAETSDGSTASATDTTIAVAAATSYDLGIDITTSGACDFYVNGVRKVAKSSNIPATNLALGPEISVTAEAAAVRGISTGGYYLVQNR